MSFITLSVCKFDGEVVETRYNTDFVKITMIKPLGADKSYVFWISAIEIGNDGLKFKADDEGSKYGCDIVAELPSEVEAKYNQATRVNRFPKNQYFTAGGSPQ